MRGLVSVAPMLAHPRYEVFPAASVEDQVTEWVPRGLTVTITASPTKGLAATLELTERLAGHGYQVVPHVSARLVRDDAHLREIVARLTAIGVDDIFVPAGDADPPAAVPQRAVAAHPADRNGPPIRPGGHHRVPGVPPAHRRRHHHPGHVGQAAALLLHRQQPLLRPGRAPQVDQPIRARGVTLPLYVGLAGPVERAKLLRMAARAGVAESARFLTGHTEWFLRLGTPGGYRPERLLDRTGTTLADPAAAVAGLHLFTFNQVKHTEQWRRSLLERLTGPGRGDVAI